MSAQQTPRLDLLFFGTPEFAVPSLERLASGPHRVVGVVSQPDRPSGRGRRTRATPVRACAERLSLDLLQSQQVGEPAALDWMREREPALGVVVAFGQFIPKSVRELPKHGLINAHASLLPRHRGAAPIQHSVLEGDRETGVTIIRVVREMDAGDWCLRRAIQIGSEETAGELSVRLSELAAEALAEAVDQIAQGKAVFEQQNHAHATLAPKIGRDFGRIDWQRPRDEVLRRIRAATPQPGCRIRLRKSGLELRLLAVSTASEGDGSARLPPGTLRRQGNQLEIAALDGSILVRTIQVPGRRPVSVDEFLRGARNLDGDTVLEEVENS